MNMKQLILIVFLIVSQFSYSQIEKDKIKHFQYGAVIGASVNLIVYDLTGSRKKAFWYGLGASFTAGLGKELLDEHNYKGFDSEDLLATVLGGVVITIPLDLLHKRFKRKRPDYNHVWSKKNKQLKNK